MIFLSKSIHLKLVDWIFSWHIFLWLKVLHTYWKEVNYCIQNFGAAQFWMDCRLKLYLWPSWLRRFSFTFKHFCVSGVKTKTFLMTTSEKAYHCISSVRFAFSNPPQVVIKIWPYSIYKMHPCSFFVSLYLVWCFSGFPDHFMDHWVV